MASNLKDVETNAEQIAVSNFKRKSLINTKQLNFLSLNSLEVRKPKINSVSKHMTVLSFQILNTKVIFNAQATTSVSEFQYLNFNNVDINIGGGFSGHVFTAPISGIYKMTFSGVSGQETEWTYITVRKNGNDGLNILDENAYKNNVSYTWMMELKAGDEVELYYNKAVYASDTFPLTFTGELIHIEN